MKVLFIAELNEHASLTDSVSKCDFKLTFAESSELGMMILARERFDCVILDLHFSKECLLSVLKKIDQYTRPFNSAVIFLTANKMESFIAQALEAGADDYILKPYDSLELGARIKCRVNKKRAVDFSSLHTVGPFEIHNFTSKVYLTEHNQKRELSITPIEFKLFNVLIRLSGQALSRHLIKDNLWGENHFLEPRSIDKHISSLRNKIKPYSNFIKTIPGEGYLFELSIKDLNY